MTAAESWPWFRTLLLATAADGILTAHLLTTYPQAMEGNPLWGVVIAAAGPLAAMVARVGLGAWVAVALHEKRSDRFGLWPIRTVALLMCAVVAWNSAQLARVWL